jgi:hypothetical protein
VLPSRSNLASSWIIAPLLPPAYSGIHYGIRECLPTRTLHQRGLDKRQLLTQGRTKTSLHVLENLLRMLYRYFESIHGPRGCLIRGRGSRTSAPRSITGPRAVLTSVWVQADLSRRLVR